MNRDTIRVALYGRASTDDQEHSVPGQLRELREQAELQGWHVVAEIRDEGEKRHTLERRGVDALRELAASGEVDEVWAWAWDRYGEYPMPDVLALEMKEDFGVSLRSLDDGGEGEDSYDMRVIKSLFSRREQRSRVQRANRGRNDKRLRGELFGGSPVRYGFRFVQGPNQGGKLVNVGYEVNEDTMPNVVLVFELIAAGESINEVLRRLRASGVPSPTGKRAWGRTSIRNIVVDDVYR